MRVKHFGGNPFSVQIFDILRGGTGKAWQGLSWRQYLRWVANTEAQLSAPDEAIQYITSAIARVGLYCSYLLSQSRNATALKPATCGARVDVASRLAR